MPSINGLGDVPSAPQQAGGLGDLDSDAFLKLLVAQMRYQDPMSPTDHTTMLQQTSQFTQVEALQRVSEQQQQLLGLSQAGIATDMIGQEITAEDPEGEEISGVVQAVRFTEEGPLLDLGDAQVPLQAATGLAASTAPTAGGAGALATDEGAPETWSGPWSHDSQDTDN